jgi:hypothetical protein
MLMLRSFFGLMFGLALGWLISSLLVTDRITIRGPDSAHVQQQIYLDSTGKSYRFVPYVVVSRGEHV